jgi:nucleolin
MGGTNIDGRPIRVDTSTKKAGGAGGHPGGRGGGRGGRGGSFGGGRGGFNRQESAHPANQMFEF